MQVHFVILLEKIIGVMWMRQFHFHRNLILKAKLKSNQIIQLIRADVNLCLKSGAIAFSRRGILNFQKSY